jgi:hypothetical protein
MNRFYQSLGMFPFVSLAADPLVLVRLTPKIGKGSALSSFSSTKRVTSRLVGRPGLLRPIFLSPQSAPMMTGILSLDNTSISNGGLAAPWGLVYDNLVFSYNTQFPSVYQNSAQDTYLFTDVTLSYLTGLYKIVLLLTLFNLKK